MSLQYIIDGYNLINHRHFTARHKKRDSRIALLELIRIRKFVASPKNKVTVVFDGYPDAEISKESGNSNIDVIFAKDQTADEKIKKIVEGSSNPKNIRVVSDDKEIKFFVQSLGAKVLNVEDFIKPDRNSANLKEKELLKPELSYAQMHRINQELRKIWL